MDHEKTVQLTMIPAALIPSLFSMWERANHTGGGSLEAMGYRVTFGARGGQSHQEGTVVIEKV